MESDYLISVIVPVHNAQAHIDRCLDALARQTVARATYQVIVVDDGSTDATCVRVQGHRGVRLLTQAHAGPAAARNLGAQEAWGEIVLFTDADCAPAHDWIERMAGPLLGSGAPASPGGGALGECGGPEHPGPSAIVGVKGTYVSQQRELVARFVQLEYEEKYERMAREEFIDFVDTYSAGYRRDVFLSNGGFDTGFPVASVEDQELSFRLARQGYRMVFVPEARVTHWGHARNLPAYWRKKWTIGYWKVLLHKRHPAKLVRDSHTPPSLKLQILLVGLGGACALGGLLWPPLTSAAAASGLAFVAATLPFAWRVKDRDRAVALLSPFLLLVRALALGTSFAAGLIANPGFGEQSTGTGRRGVASRALDHRSQST